MRLSGVFEASETGFKLQTATLTVSDACPGWPAEMSGVWRLRQTQSDAWISVDEHVPGMSGGETCSAGPADGRFTLGGTAHLYALGISTLTAPPDGAVRGRADRRVLQTATLSSGQGGETTLAAWMSTSPHLRRRRGRGARVRRVMMATTCGDGDGDGSDRR